MTPQIILMMLYFINLGMTWAKHGKPKEDQHNVWTALLALLIQTGLLWWGGFFEEMF